MNQQLQQDGLPLGALCHRKHCRPCNLFHENTNKPSCTSDQSSTHNSTVFTSATLANYHPITHDKSSLQNVGTPTIVQTVAIVDSGNLFGSAIHPRLAEHLEVDISPGTATTAALATGSNKAEVYGRVRYPIQITIGDTVTHIRPYVINNLAIPLNISFYWLKNERAKIDFNKNILYLDGSPVQLTTAVEAIMYRPPSNSKVKMLPVTTRSNPISNLGKDDIPTSSQPEDSPEVNEYPLLDTEQGSSRVASNSRSRTRYRKWRQNVCGGSSPACEDRPRPPETTTYSAWLSRARQRSESTATSTVTAATGIRVD